MLPLIDLHQDLALSERQKHPVSGAQTNFGLLDQANVRVVVATGFADVEPAYDNAANSWIEKDLIFYRKYCAANDQWRMIHTADDLDATLCGESRGILFHIEGLNALPIPSLAFKTLSRWYDLGLRSIGPMWNVSNVFGGGTNDPSTRLTSFGKELVGWCEHSGVVFDLAHMNALTFWDSMTAVHKPPFISHAGMRALVDSPRNLSDEQLTTIAKHGGVVGIYMSRGFIAPHTTREEFSLTSVIDHLEHGVRIMGHGHLALGTDYGGILSGTPKEMPTIGHIDILLNTLRVRGWSEDQIEGLAYKNAARVLRAHLQK